MNGKVEGMRILLRRSQAKSEKIQSLENELKNVKDTNTRLNSINAAQFHRISQLQQELACQREGKCHVG